MRNCVLTKATIRDFPSLLAGEVDYHLSTPSVTDVRDQPLAKKHLPAYGYVAGILVRLLEFYYSMVLHYT